MRLLFLIMLFTSSLVHSRKRALPFGVIFCKSDLIIDGKIKDIQDDYYTFEIDFYLKGKSDKNIKVLRWKDWSCDKHIRDLIPNQRLLLFLIKKKLIKLNQRKHSYILNQIQKVKLQKNYYLIQKLLLPNNRVNL